MSLPITGIFAQGWELKENEIRTLTGNARVSGEENVTIRPMGITTVLYH